MGHRGDGDECLNWGYTIKAETVGFAEMWGSDFKVLVLLFLRYREANRSVPWKEKRAHYSQFPRVGDTKPQGPRREAPGSVRRQREQAKTGTRGLIMLSGGRNRQEGLELA